MILAGLVFGVQLRPEQVVTRGIVSLTADVLDRARSGGSPIRSVATLEPTGTDDSHHLEARHRWRSAPRIRWPASTTPSMR